MIKKKKIPSYVKALLKNNPKIASGRKNFVQHNLRILKTIELIKKYFNIKY